MKKVWNQTQQLTHILHSSPSGKRTVELRGGLQVDLGQELTTVQAVAEVVAEGFG